MTALAIATGTLRTALPLLLPLAAAYWFILPGLVRQWAEDPNYAHGFFVVPMAGYLAWKRRRRFLDAPRAADARGIAIIALAGLIYAGGVLTAELFTMRFSFVVMLAGLLVTTEGAARFRTLVFPLAFLLWMIPLPYVLYYRLTFPMQIESSRLAAGFLSSVGMPLVREGNVLHLEGYSLEVVTACSGLRSIMTLGAMAMFLTDAFRIRGATALLFVALAIPIAIAANVARLASTAVLAAIGGPEAAESFLHELSGIVVFVTGMLALLACGKALAWITRARG